MSPAYLRNIRAAIGDTIRIKFARPLAARYVERQPGQGSAGRLGRPLAMVERRRPRVRQALHRRRGGREGSTVRKAAAGAAICPCRPIGRRDIISPLNRRWGFEDGRQKSLARRSTMATEASRQPGTSTQPARRPAACCAPAGTNCGPRRAHMRATEMYMVSPDFSGFEARERKPASSGGMR